MSDELSRTFLDEGLIGRGVDRVMGAVLTEYTYPGTGLDDPELYANTVAADGYTYHDCLVLNPSLLVPGRVLLLFTAAGPVILGNTYQKPPA